MTPRLIVVCESSGAVRRAFRAYGIDAWSCDLYPAEDGQPYHICGDALMAIARPGTWHGMICHPPCTHLCVSGARWFQEKGYRQTEALAFVEKLWSAPIPNIALENPMSVISTRSSLGKPTQIIQPWQFGHGETKTTCLWLKGFPKLIPTQLESGRRDRIHKMAPSPDRDKERSRTYQGIADAMAAQWSQHLFKSV